MFTYFEAIVYLLRCKVRGGQNALQHRNKFEVSPAFPRWSFKMCIKDH